MHMRNIERLKDLSVLDSGFAFDARRGDTYAVNHTGQRIIRRLLRGCDLEQIASELAGLFPMEAATIHRDLRDFVEQLRALRLADGLR
jgi:hypothetical protein